MHTTPHTEGHAPLPVSWQTSQALQACTDAALAEAPGLVMRWAGGLGEVLRQQEAWAVSPREKADLSLAIKELNRHRQAFETRWVANWRTAITEALNGQQDTGPALRSFASISFDDLELMDEVQIQATVQVARLEQVVQGAAGDALSELTALLSSAQGYMSVKMDQNPLRPDVAITALRRTMEGITRDKAVRTLWLQHGTQALGEELQLLYRHLVRILADHGVQRADYNVLQAPAPLVTRAPGARNRPPGVGDQHDDLASPLEFASLSAEPAAAPVQPEEAQADGDLLTLDGLHHLLVGEHDHAPLPFNVSPGGGAALESPRGAQVAASPGGGTAMGQPYLGPDRRAHRAKAAEADADNLSHLQALAQGVVQLLLDGMTRDERLLAPVRQMLGRLKPALLRIAQDDPRFIADKLNPARRLLEEITQRSLAFGSEQDAGFSEFVATMEDVVQLFARSDTRVSALFETALEVLQPPEPTEQVQHRQAVQGRAVASLVMVEQRFLLAEKVARELATRLDYSKADPVIQQFIAGPWAQVIAQAKMGGDKPPKPSRMPADMRYQAVLSDLIWSSRPDVASRNRSRLARLIPGVLRTLREGLQSIDYDAAASRQFFASLMARHEQGLKGDADQAGEVQPLAQVLPTGTPDAVSSPDAAGPADPGGEVPDGDLPASGETQPWLKPSESAESGFIVEPFPEIHAHDFADTVPMGRQWDSQATGAAPLNPAAGAPAVELVQGAWVELQQERGQWVRMQLSWSSPHGTMYLFTGQAGTTTSMTRRSFDNLCVQQRARVVAAHSVVDDALGGVLDTAVANSARASSWRESGHGNLPDRPETHYPDLLPPLS